jgi:hypothetical protein
MPVAQDSGVIHSVRLPDGNVHMLPRSHFDIIESADSAGAGVAAFASIVHGKADEKKQEGVWRPGLQSAWPRLTLTVTLFCCQLLARIRTASRCNAASELTADPLIRFVAFSVVLEQRRPGPSLRGLQRRSR